MKLAKDIFNAFESNGARALEIVRQKAFTPHAKKSLRTWGITETCKMVGRALQTIRDLEKENKLPIPEFSTDTGKRLYSLAHINQLRDYFGTRPQRAPEDETAIIAVTNFKGGVSKTTSAINLVQYLALKGYRVLLIDADSQGSATQCFGYIPDEEIGEDETLLDYLIGEKPNLAYCIRKTYWDGLDLIPANLALYNTEFILPVQQSEAKFSGKKFTFFNVLKSGIDKIKHNYDVIVIDCPPSMGMISINALYAANALLIPIPPAMLDFSSTIQFFGMIRDVLERLPEKSFSFIRLLITKFEKTDNAQIMVNVIRQLFGDYVALSMVPTSEAIKKASSDMLSIYEVDKYSGSKKTFDRAKQMCDDANAEIESDIHKMWLSTHQNNKIAETKLGEPA